MLHCSPMPAQIRPVAATAGTANPDILIQGHLRLDLHAGHAYWQGVRLAATGTEVKMLYLLAHRPDTPISYRELYDLVHGPGFMAGKGHAGYRANVRAFIKRIRHKFRDVDAGFDAITNLPNLGYAWRINAG